MIYQKIKLGKKEQKILEYLEQHGGSAWKSEIIDEFSWANKYNGVIAKRLERLQKKGLVEIKAEINPETGKSKQRVYLKQ